MMIFYFKGERTLLSFFTFASAADSTVGIVDNIVDIVVDTAPTVEPYHPHSPTSTGSVASLTPLVVACLDPGDIDHSSRSTSCNSLATPVRLHRYWHQNQ